MGFGRQQEPLPEQRAWLPDALAAQGNALAEVVGVAEREGGHLVARILRACTTRHLTAVFPIFFGTDAPDLKSNSLGLKIGTLLNSRVLEYSS